jgi:hypothetical protein
MTEEQFEKAISLNRRLEQLAKVKEEIADVDRRRLQYMSNYVASEWKPVKDWVMKFIEGILDRHDKQIRQEIEDEISQIKQEIEKL